MSKIAIVTDSTACIPESYLSEYTILVVPLQLIMGEEVMLDGVEITPDEFYEKLENSKLSPSTSQPSPDAFVKVFQPLLDEGYDIISILISSKLSGTVASAEIAKNQLGSSRIEVIDSKLTSMAMGFPILAVAKAAKEGATLQECKGLAEATLKRSGAMFTVSTLEFLRRGGRIGSAAAFLGTALNLKPVLELREGVVEPIERVRTHTKAVYRLIELLGERSGRQSPLQVAALHAKSPLGAAKIIEEIRKEYNVSDISEAFCVDISPVLGAHTGPGTLGIAYTYGL